MATITSPGRTGFGGGTRASAASPWRHVDLTLIGAVLAIAALGMLMVYSATRNALEFNNLDPQYYLQRQAIFVGVGLCVMVAATVFDYRFFRDRAAMLYGGTLFLLLLVISPLGSNKKGTQAWFQLGPYQLQPSEFAKITLIIAIAAFVGSARGAELDLRRFLTVLAIGGAPIGLVYLQPDLGTALVSLAILLGMLLVAGAKAKHLAALVLLGVVAMVAVVQLGVLKQYQLDRLSAFLDPAGDTQRSTYNLAQSKTAIGSGGVSGKGLFQGTQTNLSYVPEQHTDFIFTVAGEELGLLGAGTVIVLFGLLLWRGCVITRRAPDLFGTLACTGVVCWLGFQAFQNIGMALGIMPVTGLPLPFVSYGGSAMLANLLAVGLLLNVHARSRAR
jgi:rod shape determining protein RodA